MFWNIYKKNLIGPIIQVILENNVDVLTLAEAEKLDINSLINTLSMHGCRWKTVEVCPGPDIRLLAKREVSISVYREEKRFSSYKLFIGETMYLLHVVHLHSSMHLAESARYDIKY